MKPIKVLHVFGSMSRGGAELRTLEVMKACPRERFRFDCLSLSGRPGELDREVEALGGSVHLLSRGPRFGIAFARLLARGRYDVIHSHVLYYTGFLLRSARHAGVRKRIAHFRSSDTLTSADPLHGAWHRMGRELIAQDATAIVAVSEAAMRGVWSPDWREDPRCRVIYNGIDQRPFLAQPQREAVRAEFDLPPECLLLIHVGNVTPPKNHARLLGIYAELVRGRPEIALLLVGEGTADLARRAAASFPLLRGAGKRGDIARLLNAGDAQAHPSLSEGLPGAVLEGAAAGLPIVGSAISAIREVAKHVTTISCIPLSASDACWAKEINHAFARRGQAKIDRDAFVRTPFGFTSAVNGLLSLWEGIA